MKMKTLFGIVALASLGLMANTGTANAAASFCLPGPDNVDGMNVNDITFRLSAADDCYGIVGDSNVSVSDINNVWGSVYGGGDFGYVTDVGDDTTINGLNYAFSATNAGVWTLAITDPAPAGVLPVTLDILFYIGDLNTSPDTWKSYLFNDETFGGVGSNAGTWTWTGVNSTPDTAFLAFRNGTPGTGSGSGSGQAAVPEPASLLLLGSGLGAAAWRARRKKQQ